MYNRFLGPLTYNLLVDHEYIILLIRKLIILEQLYVHLVKLKIPHLTQSACLRH